MLILGIFLVIELIFSIFTILKQKEKKCFRRNRCLVNGGELLLFLLLTLLPGVDLGFRYMFFFVILLIRFILSAIIYLCSRKKEGVKRTGICVAGTIVNMLLLFVALIPSLLFTAYEGKPTSGKYDVAQSQVILVDQSRVETFESDGSKREVPVYFYYPQNAKESESFPLVVFSHGAFGYYQSNTSTYMELASNGYVVMSLDHPYHSFFTNDTDGKLITVNPQFMQDVNYVNEDKVPEEEIIRISQEWLKLREDDMNFVIDTVKAANATGKLPTDTWYMDGSDEQTILNIEKMINTKKIGVMGHSLGGASSVALGRMRDDIGAVIDLDGTMLSEELGYENGKYIMNEMPYPVPVLSIDSELHHNTCLEEGSYYVNNVVMDHAIDGQRTYVKGSAHMNFTDLPLFSPALASLLGTGDVDANHCMDIVNSIVLSYMNTYLKDEGNFRVQECYE